MAFHVRPQTDCFALAWSRDDAFARPPDPKSDDDKEAIEAMKAWHLRFDAATETQDFAPLVKEGAKPTLFYFRPIEASRMRRLIDLLGGKAGIIAAELAFRMAIVRIENLGIDDAPKLEKGVDPDARTLGQILKRDVSDWFDGLAAAAGAPFGAIVHELGSEVYARGLSVSGK